VTCIFCHSWGQSDPNCGHYLESGTLTPAGYATRAWRDAHVLGGRAKRYADAENGRAEWTKLDHIVRMANLALSGGGGRHA
jgi:hypothetical protein